MNNLFGQYIKLLGKPGYNLLFPDHPLKSINMNYMKRSIFLILACIIPYIYSCKKDTSAAAQEKQVQLTLKQKAIVEQSNSFGFDFFRKVMEVSGDDNNLMISPLSVSMAFGMTRNGAAGSTLEAMNSTLGLSGMTDQEANESFKYILETFGGLDPKVNVSIANSIWYKDTFTVEQDFIETDKTYFNAEVNALNFSDPASVETINGWVSDNTNNLIPKIIDNIPDDMVMYLINAIYFKGQWKYKFDENNTTDKTFQLSDGSSVIASSMLQHTNLKYYNGEGFEAVELPYNQGNYNMVIFLPDQGSTVTSVIEKLTLDNWNNWYRQFATMDIQLQMPKFKFAYEEKEMKAILSDMGMAVAFNPDLADFTRINSLGGLYISEVRHKTFIETNEAGTEAAAVTSIGIGVTSVGEDPLPYEFIVNRPFVFFIHEKSTGSILFFGTVMNPTIE
jgi:serpin B